VKQILLIDDSPLVIEAVRDALEPDGITVAELSDVSAPGGARALDEFSLNQRVVQVAASLGGDIEGVMRRRSRDTAPIVLLSSLGEEELAERARASGSDGYILNQRGVDELVDEVRAWLDGRRPRRGGAP
jgi:DNA-binding NarL/FixJ family response regulator